MNNDIKTVLPKPRIRIDEFGDITPITGNARLVTGYFYDADQMREAIEAAVLSALTPPTWRCCEKMVEQGAGNMVCCGEPIEVAVLSANACKVDAWQPIESAPQGTLSLFVDMGADEVRNLYFVDWMVGGLFCGIRTRNATHWMPLPAAPTQQASDAWRQG